MLECDIMSDMDNLDSFDCTDMTDSEFESRWSRAEPIEQVKPQGLRVSGASVTITKAHSSVNGLAAKGNGVQVNA